MVYEIGAEEKRLTTEGTENTEKDKEFNRKGRKERQGRRKEVRCLILFLTPSP